jgi:nitrate/TMAO reductase-like tetraheme cytochrome c subunit
LPIHPTPELAGSQADGHFVGGLPDGIIGNSLNRIYNTYNQASERLSDFYRSLTPRIVEIQANTEQALVTIAVLAIGIALLAISAQMILLWIRRRTLRGALTRLLLFPGILAAAGLFLLVVSIPVTNSSSFCGQACHSMNAQYQSWRQSPHSTVSCAACHSPGGLSGPWRRAVISAREIQKEYTGDYRKPISPGGIGKSFEVSDKRCLGCHDQPGEESGALRVGHRAHGEREMNCTDCHNRVGHDDVEKYPPTREWITKGREDFIYPDYTNMEIGCRRCHRESSQRIALTDLDLIGDGAVAAKGCEICPPYLSRRALESQLKTIFNRHREESGGEEWSGWPNHGDAARQVEFRACFTCHDPKDRCTVCHQGITMPHAANWPRIHGTYAGDRSRCYRCHGLTEELNSCRRCHHERFAAQYGYADTKDWASGKRQHGIAARQNTAACLRCHDRKTWCATECHEGVTMPHTADWRQVHWKTIGYKPIEGNKGGWKPRTTPCDKCHNSDGESPNFCWDCHHAEFKAEGYDGRPLWVEFMRFAWRAYGTTFKLDNADRCLKCHEAKFCRDCHFSYGEIDDRVDDEES